MKDRQVDPTGNAFALRLCKEIKVLIFQNKSIYDCVSETPNFILQCHIKRKDRQMDLIVAMFAPSLWDKLLVWGG